MKNVCSCPSDLKILKIWDKKKTKHNLNKSAHLWLIGLQLPEKIISKLINLEHNTESGVQFRCPYMRMFARKLVYECVQPTCFLHVHVRGQRPVLPAFPNAPGSRTQAWWNHRKLDCLPFALEAAWKRHSCLSSSDPPTPVPGVSYRSTPHPLLWCTPASIPLLRHVAPKPPAFTCHPKFLLAVQKCWAGCQQSAQ